MGGSEWRYRVRFRRVLLLAMMGFIGLMVACGGPGSPAEIQVQIEPSEVSLAPEGSQEFTATVSGSDEDLVEWSATGGVIDGEGAVVTYVAPAEAGEYSVTVTSTVDSSKSASASVTVLEDGEGSVLGVSIFGGDRTLTVGESISLVAEVDVVGDASEAVLWSSGDATVATVDVDGVVTGVGVGSVTITATSEADAAVADSIEVVVEAGASGARIEITSDSEVLLTGAGESTTLTAVVYRDDGSVDPDAEVVWESSDPDAVSVDEDGVATALVDAGYANVSASAAGLEPAVVAVAVAVPLEGTQIVDASRVLGIDVDSNRVLLVRTSETEAIGVGDVLVSNAGLLGHVLAVSASGDEVEVEFEVAELSDAFERVVFSSSTGPVLVDTVITDAGVFVQTSTLDGDYVGRAAFGIDALECKNEIGRPIEVSFTASEFDTNILNLQDRITAVFAYDSADEDVFLAYVRDHSRLEMTLGRIEIDVGGGVKATCSYELASFMVPFATFWGLISIGGTVTPKIGLEVEARYQGASLEVEGPSVEASVEFTAGVSYNKRTGEWSNLSGSDVDIDAKWGSLVGALEHSLSFYVGPFFEADFGVDLAVLTRSAAGVNVVTPRLSVGVAADVPLGDRYAAEYSGPDMELRADVGAKVGLELTGDVDWILKRMGIRLEAELADFSVYSNAWDLLPRPEVSVLPQLGSGAYPLSALVQLDNQFMEALAVNRTHEFVAFADGDETGTVVGTATINQFGVAQTEWLPGVDVSTLSSGVLSGDIRMVGLLYDRVFGGLNAPIVARSSGYLFVPEQEPEQEQDGAPPVADAPLVGGVRPDGTFTTDGGVFFITLSPRDEQGNLITEGVTIDSFAFRDIEVAPASSPDSVVASATATITDVEIRQPTEGEAVSLVLDFDTSGSMFSNDPNRLSIQAGKDIVDLLRPGDQAAVVEFGGSTASVVQGLTDDRELLKQRIDSLSFGGLTPLYDSIWKSLDLLDAAGASNPAVVILADGDNNRPPYDFNAIVNQANAQGAPLFTIGLGSAANHAQLQDFADLTGGVYAEAVDADGLEELFDAIGFGIIQGRVIVSAEGVFQPRLDATGDYVVQGVLETTIGGSTVDTPFSFAVTVE